MESGARGLHRRCPKRAAAPEQGVFEEGAAILVRDFRENVDRRSDDELCIPELARTAHAERFTAAHEHDLIRIAHYLVVPDVPDKKPGVRQTDLEVVAKAFSAFLG